MQQQTSQGAAKYKTMLCKHFEQTKNCSHRDKCQFAHGVNELRSNVNNFYLNFSKVV